MSLKRKEIAEEAEVEEDYMSNEFLEQMHVKKRCSNAFFIQWNTLNCNNDGKRR